MIVESVQYDTFEPISTVMIDIKKARYADFKEWYPDICVTKDGIELDNRFHKVKKMILKNTCDLEWIDLSTGIGTTKWENQMEYGKNVRTLQIKSKTITWLLE